MFGYSALNLILIGLYAPLCGNSLFELQTLENVETAVFPLATFAQTRCGPRVGDLSGGLIERLPKKCCKS